MSRSRHESPLLSFDGALGGGSDSGWRVPAVYEAKSAELCRRNVLRPELSRSRSTVQFHGTCSRTRVECTPDAFVACRSDEALTCNAIGNDYSVTQCPLGCSQAAAGCVACVSLLDCKSTILSARRRQRREDASQRRLHELRGRDLRPGDEYVPRVCIGSRMPEPCVRQC